MGKICLGAIAPPTLYCIPEESDWGAKGDPPRKIRTEYGGRAGSVFTPRSPFQG